MPLDLDTIANRSLEAMQRAGFDSALVNIAESTQNELNIAQNEPSLLRTTEGAQLALVGIVDGRKASTMLTDLDEGVLEPAVKELFENANLSPQDEANAVSADQTASFEQGPLECDTSVLTEKAKELIEFRKQNAPKMNLEEGIASHVFGRELTTTTSGTRLHATTGCYQLMVFGAASDGSKTSSFNHAGGSAYDLSTAPAQEFFGLGSMMQETEEQIETEPFDGNFVGDVILAPGAVSDLVHWLLGQLSDSALIANASVYRDKVGEVIAAPALSVVSRFDGPGDAPFSHDGFLAPGLDLVSSGKLTCLLLSFYGSRKLGINHTPVASGWRVLPGETPLANLVGSVEKGALVNRLSMGSPAANGDFSAVIKNSFKIEDGKRGEALAEAMIAGNMAKVLSTISGISLEHRDTGDADFPWIRVPGLHFS